LRAQVPRPNAPERPVPDHPVNSGPLNGTETANCNRFIPPARPKPAGSAGCARWRRRKPAGGRGRLPGTRFVEFARKPDT